MLECFSGVSEANLAKAMNCFQVLHAQQAGYSAAIIHNMYSNTLLNMNYSNGERLHHIDSFKQKRSVSHNG